MEKIWFLQIIHVEIKPFQSTIFIQMTTIWFLQNHTFLIQNKHFQSTIFIQMATIWFLQIIHVDRKPTLSLGRFQLFSYKKRQFDSSKSYMLIPNQPIQSTIFIINGNNLIAPHTFRYKTSLFCQLFHTNSDNLILPNHTCRYKTIRFSQLISYKWQQFDSSEQYRLIEKRHYHSADFNYIHYKWQQFGFTQIIHVDIKPTFALRKFQPFSNNWQHFDSSKSSMLIQNQPFNISTIW